MFQIPVAAVDPGPVVLVTRCECLHVTEAADRTSRSGPSAKASKDQGLMLDAEHTGPLLIQASWWIRRPSSLPRVVGSNVE